MSQSKIFKSLEKNKNLMYNNMTKLRESNFKYLLSIARKAKGEATPKVNKILTLYNQSKISQVQTAENIINKLINNNTEKEEKKILKQYDKLINKYQANEPLNKRLVEKKQVKKTAATKIIKAFKKHLEPRIEFKNLNKAQNQIEFYLDHIKGYTTLDLTQLYPKLRNKILNETRKLLIIKNNIKLTMGMKATWIRFDKETGETESLTQPVKTTTIEVYSKDNVNDVLDKLFDKLELLVANLKYKKSGYTLKKIHYIFVESFSIKPIRGSSYIPTPERFNNKSGLINIQNYDNECFKWCMKYHQSSKVKHSDRISVLKQLEDKFNYDNVKFPAGYNDIKQFEENNKVCIFVYTLSTDNEIIRDYVGNPDYIMNDNINLLRIEDEDKSHYIYIKHLSRLINLNAHKSHHGCWCPYCEKPQPEENIKDHIGKCYKLQFNDGALLKLPEKDTYMKFENHKNKLVRPFIIYADTESTLEKRKI